ncbi:hypothetical protein ACMT9Y_15230 [Clavibacter tessellarius]|uniref:hypothetical protein n=1 Tax=Clavibacter tessellarius TaxID=31965 RepID=UPI0039E8920E
MGSERDYEERSDRYAEQTEPIRGVGPALTGQAATAAGRAFLVAEYGSEAAVEAVIGRGRPPLGETPGKISPSVTGRLVPARWEEFKRLEKETGRTQSELVREGVELLLQAHRAVAS